MKRGVYLLFALISFFLLLTGCDNQEQKNTKLTSTNQPSAPANLKKVTGKVVKATLDKNNNIVINKNDITEDVTYISYEYEGTTIGLLAVKDSKGNVKVVVNTCQSCAGSPYAYFVQVGDKIQCQNCGNTFAIDDLDNLVAGGCNPIGLTDKKEDKTKITIGTNQLKDLKAKFSNWQGPKV